MDTEPPSSFLSNILLNDIDLIAIAPFLVIIAVLLLLSGLVSGSEVSFFSLTSTHIEDLKSSKDKREQLVLSLLERPRSLLATILISNNFINVGIVILSTFVIDQIFDFSTNPLASIIIEIFAVTTLILLFGEIMPKVYATASPLAFARVMARPLKACRWLFYPLIKVLIGVTKVFERPAKNSSLSVDDLEHALELTEDENTDTEEHKILEGIVKFGNTTVRQTMTPRTEVVALEIEEGFSKVLRDIVEHGFSRMPVYQDNLDQIKGVIYIKDLLPHIDEGDNFNWNKLVRDPFFVPETKKIDDLLKEFQEKKIHLAVVVDEFGGTSGVITLEDVIEEIVGEISDEFDVEDLVYSKLDDHTYVFEGRTSLIDFYKVLDIEEEPFEEVKGDSDTLAGFLLEISGKFPEPMEIINFNDFEFKVENIENRRIQRIKVSLPHNFNA